MTDAATDDGLPVLDLAPADETVALIQMVQKFVLTHPAAAKAIFAGLMAEGRAFAQTPPGATARQELEQSELVHKARLLLDLPGLSMLEPDDGAVLPSTLVDTVFMMAANSEDDGFLSALFEVETPDVR